MAILDHLESALIAKLMSSPTMEKAVTAIHAEIAAYNGHLTNIAANLVAISVRLDEIDRRTMHHTMQVGYVQDYQKGMLDAMAKIQDLAGALAAANSPSTDYHPQPAMEPRDVINSVNGLDLHANGAGTG